MISLKKDIGVVLNLKSEEEIIILGIIRNYFNEFWFNISFNDVTESKGLYDNIDAVKLTRDKNIDGEITSKFYTPSTNREFLIRPNVYYYDFIYKKIDLPISTLVNESSSITIMKEMEDYFKLKYPQFMNLIKRLKPKSTTDVKFMDLFDFGNGIYFGEWRFQNTSESIPIKEGRGITLFKNGSKQIGYYENDKMNGTGELVLLDNTKIIGNFVNDKLDGKVTKMMSDGKIIEAFFNNGVEESSLK